MYTRWLQALQGRAILIRYEEPQHRGRWGLGVIRHGVASNGLSSYEQTGDDVEGVGGGVPLDH